jgi:drug/metabolite transporter (DMT)-like permease
MARSDPQPASAPQAFAWQAVAFAVLINLLWGGNVPAVKVGLLAIPPLWTGFWRFLLGAACITAWSLLNGIPLRPGRGEWWGLGWLALLFTLQIGLMNLGIRHTTGAMAAILIATNPLFAGLIAHVFVPGDRINARRGTGLLIAFAGICLVFLRDLNGAPGGGGLLGNGLCLASAALLAGRLVLTSRLVQTIDTTRVVLWQMVFSLPCFAVAGWFTEQVAWDRLGWYPLAGIAYQGIVVAGFNFMGLAYLLRRYSPSAVVSFNFLSPLFGVLLSVLLLSESISWHVLAGLAAVGVGLFLVARR